MRCITLLPDGLDPRVQRFRELHDPLAYKIQPHITVVFPFGSSVGDEALVHHVTTVLAAHKRFRGTLGPLKRVAGGWIYNTLDEGTEEVRRIRDKLHTGPLVNLPLRSDYEPHITIARVDDTEQHAVFNEAMTLQFEPSFTVIEALIEGIADDESSIEIARVPLR